MAKIWDSGNVVAFKYAAYTHICANDNITTTHANLVLFNNLKCLNATHTVYCSKQDNPHGTEGHSYLFELLYVICTSQFSPQKIFFFFYFILYSFTLT